MVKKILKTLTNNFGFKLLAVFLAFILWIVVYNLEDPVKTKMYTTVVTIENASTVTNGMHKWYEVVGGTNQVSFLVSGKRSILEKLDDSDFTATADLKNLVLSEDGTKGTVHIDITCNKTVYSSLLNLNSKNKHLELALEDMMKKQIGVTVEASGKVAEGYTIDYYEVKESNITVSGPESIVKQIDKIKATIDVDGMFDDMTENNIVPVLYDENEVEIPTTRLSLSSNTVTVTAHILATKEVPIKFETSGSPAGDNEVLSVKGSASSVLIKGNAAALNSISSIDIDGSVLNVEGATEDIVTTIDINEFLPEGVKLVDGNDAQIKVTIKIKSISTRTINVSTDNITVNGLRKDYDLEFETGVFSIAVTGADADLSELTADKILGTINVSALSEGTHTVTVDIQLDTAKYKFDAVAVRVTIKKKQTDEPQAPEDDSSNNSDNTDDANTDNTNTDNTNDGTVDENNTDGSVDESNQTNDEESRDI